MSRYSGQRSKKAGLAPGTPVHIGARKAQAVSISFFSYNEDSLEEKRQEDLHRLMPPSSDDRIHWTNIDGLHQVDLLEKLGACYGLHPLVVEDMLNTEQRPKLEDYGHYLYIVLRVLAYDSKTGEMIAEQQSIVLGRNFVLSVGEREGDVFGPIRERLRTGTGRIRKMGADYLAYSLLDAIVDNYFSVMEQLGDRIEEAEEALIGHPAKDTLREIIRLKREMMVLHKAIWPLREVTSSMERGESPLIGEATRLYVRDVYDHVIQAMDTTETYRDILSSLTDIYLSSVSNRMNEVMKVLTVISTVFIPLTFIAGVYGMNFRVMPELEWPWGYFAVLFLMAGVAGSMLVYFRRKKWF